MAPSAGGHLLVSKGLRLIRFAAEKASRLLRDKLPQAAQPLEAHAEPVYIRVTTKQTANRLAAIRQSQSRWFSSRSHADNTVRHFSSSAGNATKPARSSYPVSRTGRAVSQLTSRTPFASTLRPNLTGGTLQRSAGGYNIGAGRVNGVRYFSHTPAPAAEVIQNVSQAVRAFWISGQKAHFNGYNPKTGEKRFRAVSALQDKARHGLDNSPARSAGSFIDFKVSPTITAVGPLSAVPRSFTSEPCLQVNDTTTLDNSNVITNLEIDFARALKDLAAIMNDLKNLSTLGSLPLELVDQSTLRVRFPGCDGETVEALCLELNIRRGIVGQDPDFDVKNGTEMALLFPYAPSSAPSMCEEQSYAWQDEDCFRPSKRNKHRTNRRDEVEWQHMLSPAQYAASPVLETEGSADSHLIDAEVVDNPWLSSPSGYSSLHASEENVEYGKNGDDVGAMFLKPTPSSKQHYHSVYGSKRSHDHMTDTGFEGVEGICRFLEQCDRARR